jgi:hypothetical protein
MTRWTLAVAAILMLFASASFGQGFSVSMSYYGPPPLTTVCNGSIPIPDGRIVKLFQDQNPPGPDPTDLQPVVCNNPPACEDGPQGTVNYNQFTVNGVANGLGEGYFNTSRACQSAGGMPAGSRNYYLRLYEPDGVTVIWTSTVFTLHTGFQEVDFVFEDWTCGQGGAQCVVVDETE